MSENQSELIDLKGLWRLYRSKWRFFAISIVICGAIGFLFSLRILPKYEIKGSLMLNQEQSSLGAMFSGSLSGVSDLIGGNANGEDEVQVIQSHSLLTEVVKELGLERMHYKRLRPTVYQLLYNDYPVDVIPGDDINTDTLRTKLRCTVKVSDSGNADLTILAKGKEIFSGSGLTMPAEAKTDYGTFTLVATDKFKPGDSFKNRIEIMSAGTAAEELREAISIGLASKNSQIIEFQMFSSNVAYSIDVINAIMNTYIARTESEQVRRNASMTTFLQTRLNEVRRDLENTEVELTNLKETSGITGLATMTDAINERLAAAEEAATTARVNSEIASLTLQMVKESVKEASLIPLQGDSPEIAQMISTYNDLILRRNSIVQSARPDNSAVQRLDEQISAMRDNLLSTLEVVVKRTKEYQVEYEKILSQMTGEIGRIPQIEYDLHDIYRKRTIEEQVYLFLAQKIEETSMLMGTMDSQATIIDRAYALDEDQAMSPLVIMVLAIFFGLMIPPVWLYFFKPAESKAETESENRPE